MEWTETSLTAAEATGQLNIVNPAPIAERQYVRAGWNGAPGLQTAVSIHIEAEELAFAHRSWRDVGIKREV